MPCSVATAAQHDGPLSFRGGKRWRDLKLARRVPREQPVQAACCSGCRVERWEIDHPQWPQARATGVSSQARAAHEGHAGSMWRRRRNATAPSVRTINDGMRKIVTGVYGSGAAVVRGRLRLYTPAEEIASSCAGRAGRSQMPPLHSSVPAQRFFSGIAAAVFLMLCRSCAPARQSEPRLPSMFRDLLNKVVSSVRGGDRADDDSTAQLRESIAAIEKQVVTASPQQRPQLYNRLGDVYTKGGDVPSALKAYGRAIDGYLENGYYDAAAALCRKVIELKPDVIRARCTLAFLSLGKELLSDAQREISQYVDASRRVGQEELAIKRLHLMAEATDSHDTRTLLGEMLLELGDEQGADAVLGAVNAERNRLTAPPPEEQRERWARLLRTAITDMEELPPEDTKRRRGMV